MTVDLGLLSLEKSGFRLYWIAGGKFSIDSIGDI